MADILRIGLIIIGMPLIGFALITWLLHYFVALRSTPLKRAAWIVGIAYLVLAAVCIVAVPLEYWWAAPLAPLPGALIAFWWWRNDFQRDWIDDAQGVPDEVELATDDWLIGLLQLLAAVTVVFGIAVLKFVLRAT